MDYKYLGDYIYYTDQIGQGSFSVIYRGYRIKNRQPVAIKKITRYIDKKYIDSEIELMKNMDNNNILKLYEVIKLKDCLYLILEYCNQGHLGNYIASGNNKQDDKYIFQIISSLKYLYDRQILHRDIKPQNILIHNNEIKICDFGFAKTIKENDLISTFCGSPLYMAPEIIKFNKYGLKADIWSLGVVIYEILFKEHPYPSKNQSDLIDNIKNDIEIKVPNIINKDLKYILENMLHKNPDLRINWDQIFASDWVTEYKYICSNVSNIISNPLKPLPVDIPKPDNNSFLLFNMDEDTELHSNPVGKNYHSVYEKSSLQPNYQNPNCKSVIDNGIIINITNYDDSKVYSRSAPNESSSKYLENYINKKVKKTEDDSYKIVGTSPSPNKNNSGFLYCALNKSVNTLKNFFNV